jgi:dephospho-CoA kinase
MFRIIGLTGPVACGKSTVAKRLERAGIPVVDADELAHEVLADRNGPAHHRILAAFGEGVLGDDGCIDRQKVAQMVFQDQDKLKKLNSITHPLIGRAIMRHTAALVCRGHGTVVLDIPLLLRGLHPGQRPGLVGKVIVVKARPELQCSRLMARNGFSEADALRRIRAVMSGDEQAKYADFVIDNSAGFEELNLQVDQMLTELSRGFGMPQTLAVATAVVAGLFSLARSRL